MSLKIRRVVTGHDQNGRAVVAIDEIAKNVISRRPHHASCVIWSSGEFPTDNDGDEDGGTREVAHHRSEAAPCSAWSNTGRACAPRNHRTELIDYAVVMSARSTWTLTAPWCTKAGDVLVQRGTIHNWNNRGTVPCVVAFVLVAAKPVSGRKSLDGDELGRFKVATLDGPKDRSGTHFPSMTKVGSRAHAALGRDESCKTAKSPALDQFLDFLQFVRRLFRDAVDQLRISSPPSG